MKLVADANVPLSPVLGGRAGLILSHPRMEEVFTTRFTLSEVQEYAAQLAAAEHLSTDAVLLATATLPVNVLDRDAYASALPEAERRIVERDVDDIDVLALALHLKLPLRPNDRDFEKTGIERYTTAQPLGRLL